MRRLCAAVVAALAIICGVPHTAAPSPLSTISVVSGGWVTVPLSGAGRVDASPEETAFAWTAGDSVTVYGLHPGRAILTLTYADSIEARPVQVVGAPPDAPSLEGDRGTRCAGPLQVRAADQSHLAVDADGVSLDWSRGAWNLAWNPPDLRVSASSALGTPLESLGVPAAPGIQAEWQPGWQLMATPTLGLLGYHFAGAGSLLVGDSALGPAALIDAAVGPARVSAAGVRTPSGDMLAEAEASVSLGAVSLGYATGPAGGSPTVGYHHGPLSLSAAATPGQGVQVGVGLALADGATIGGGWGTDGSWRARVALALGPGGPAPARTAACHR